MKKCVLILICFISCIGFAQDNHIVQTEDGRIVLLKADYTWEYVDTETSALDISVTNTSKQKKSTSCNLTEDFIEPKLNKKIQSQLKKGRATIVHVKKKVAKDYKCNVEDIVLLSVSESKAKGVYNFCANGKKVTYKRNGHSVAKKIDLF